MKSATKERELRLIDTLQCRDDSPASEMAPKAQAVRRHLDKS